MTLSELPKDALEDSLRSLRRLFDAASQEYQEKYLQFQALGNELNVIQESMRSFRTAMSTVEKALGISSQPVLLPEGEIKREIPVDATETVMRLVAAHHESGGISFDQIFQSLKSQGHKTSREYLHTILNRKKNYQKKLKKENGRWLLTDKGKEELGIKV
jgi:hypothetical protein